MPFRLRKIITVQRSLHTFCRTVVDVFLTPGGGGYSNFGPLDHFSLGKMGW